MTGGCERRWRQVTASLRMRPDFIIPGEAKCGTTSFYRYLCEHPDVFAASMKEPNNFWRHGASPLQCGQHYPLRVRRSLRRLIGRKTLTGEASPEYFTKKGVAKSISEVVPNVRLIFLFRNPVDRAFSDHQMLIKAGVEKESFAVRMEQSFRWYGDPDTRELLEACDDLEHHPGRYLTRGLYADHLAQWMEYFPREQMLFLESEQLFSHPAEVVDEALKFLGSEPLRNKDWPVFKKGRYVEEMDSGLRENLDAFYAGPNRRLAELTGRDWSWAQ